MKRTHGELTGHIAGKVIDWLSRRWFSVTIALSVIYVAYSVHVLVLDFETVGARFLNFTSWFYEWADKRGTLS